MGELLGLYYLQQNVLTFYENWRSAFQRLHMPEKPQTDKLPQKTLNISLKSQALLVYGRILDVIVSILVFVMVLTLLGALAGLVIDFFAAASSFSSAVSSHNIAHGIVDGIDRQLVIDVLSVFVLIELFRTFTDYLEFRRVRLRVLAEVGIAFVLREIFIGLYDHSLNWTEILAFSVLLAVLVSARIAAVQFQANDNSAE